jgi:hypothetical protein
MRTNEKLLLRIFSGFFLRALSEFLPMPANHTLGSSELRWRFPAEFLEHAIELRQRLKSCGERDVTDPQSAVI